MTSSHNLVGEGTSSASRKKYVIFAALGCVVFAVILGVAIGVPLSKRSSGTGNSHMDIAIKVLSEVPLVDGHNDLPYQYYRLHRNQVKEIALRENQKGMTNIWDNNPALPLATDIPRLKEGQLGAQFWALYVKCATQYKDAVRTCLDQADVIKRMVEEYPDTFRFVTTADGIQESFDDNRIGSLIGMEGGHCIDSSLATLRMFYDIGVRYMTLTHSCNTPWADASPADDEGGNPENNGLSEFGKDVVREMNRVGMIVDLSHVSKKTMMDALEVTEAPVMYSHSSAYSLCNHSRNVRDDVLQLTKKNGGVVMVNFYNSFITCNKNATLSDVADHFDYIKNLIGADHVGVGSDYDGVYWVPEGLEDVSTYPALFAELSLRGWSEDDLKKAAGLNIIRVFKKVEEIRDKKKQQMVSPFDNWIPDERIANISDCREVFYADVY